MLLLAMWRFFRPYLVRSFIFFIVVIVTLFQVLSTIVNRVRRMIRNLETFNLKLTLAVPEVTDEHF